MNSDTLFRGSQLTRVQVLSDVPATGLDAPFLAAVVQYLIAPARDQWLANKKLGNSTSSVRANWYGVVARKSLSDISNLDPAGRKAKAISVIDQMVEQLQQRYADVFSAYHALAASASAGG